MQKTLNPQHQRFIEEAAAFLEKPSFLVQATDKLGRPLEKIQTHLPEPMQQLIRQAMQQALKSALQVAIKSLPQQKVMQESWPDILEETQRLGWKHTAAATTTGALSGAFGAAALMVELPLTTSLILRSISAMAQQWGHDLRQAEIQMQCLYVFTLGSPRHGGDDAMDAAYLSARLAYHGLIRELAAYISAHSLKDLLLGLEKGTLPALVKFAALFIPALERTLLRSMLSKSIPVLSIVGSAALNAGFCQYFTRAARYHFGLLHLESIHGSELVHEHYERAARAAIEYQKIRLIS